MRIFTERRSNHGRGRAALREVEIERVEQLDRGIRRVHLNVGRRVEERLGVVEDDLHAGVDEGVGGLLGASSISCRRRCYCASFLTID